jgi:hypothetical protein
MIRQPPTGGKRLEYVAAVLSDVIGKISPLPSFMELGKDLDSIVAKLNP